MLKTSPVLFIFRGVSDMAKLNTVTMRVDENLVKQAEFLCEDMGLTLSTFYTMLLKAIVRTRSIPFKIQANDPFYSEKNQEYLMGSIRELEAGHGQEHELILN